MYGPQVGDILQAYYSAKNCEPLYPAGKISFLLFSNVNSNVTSDDHHRIRQKAVDLQVQIFSAKDEAKAVLFCFGPQVVAPAS